MFKSLAFAAIFALSLGSVAFADHHEMMGPCHDEMKALCPDAKGKEMMKCIKEKKSQLTPECQAKLEEKKEHMKEKMHEWGKACKGDVKKLCKDVEKGEGRILECLKSHEAELSASCKEKMDKK